MTKAKVTVILLVLCLCQVAMGLPRFNRADHGFKDYTGLYTTSDTMHYEAMASIYRGETPKVKPDAPFTYRFLVPLLASFLPVGIASSLNVINLLFMFCALFCVYGICRHYAISQKRSLLGCAFMVFSFPSFYYTTIGYIDPGFIGLLALAYWATISKRWLVLFATLIAGMLTKEAMVMVLPIILSFLVVGKMPPKQIVLLSFISLFCCLAGLYISRTFCIQSDVPTYFWGPSFSRLLGNLARPRTWVSFILSMGVSWMVLVKAKSVLRLLRDQAYWPLLVGFVMCLALSGYALIAAYADGRSIWPAMIFAIPLFLKATAPDASQTPV